MIGFEETFTKIIRSERFWQKTLIGGLLCFLPPLTILALGYLYRYGLQVKKQGRLTLPEWEQWDRLLVDGIRFTILVILLFVLPLVAALIIGWVLQEISLGLLLPASYLCISLTALATPTVLAWGWLRYSENQDFTALLHYRSLLRVVQSHWQTLLLPTLAFWAVHLMGAPLLGFASFFGFVFFLPYAILTITTSTAKKSDPSNK